MSTPPGLPHPHWRATRSTRIISRTGFLVVAVTLIVTSATSVAGFEPDQPETRPVSARDALAADPALFQTVAPNTGTAQPATTEIPTAARNCNPLFPDFCIETSATAPAMTVGSDATTACALPGEHTPTGTLTTVPAPPSDTPGDSPIRLQIEIEDGLAIDSACFAATAMAILTDDRGWTNVEDVNFSQVDDDRYDLKLVLASPPTTDSLCYPADTVGRYSCRNGDSVVINLMRWESGTDDYTDDLTAYRHYLLNHEVGHFLGKGHLSCPAAGEPAPVMMQQTKGLGECLPNGWPTEDER